MPVICLYCEKELKIKEEDFLNFELLEGGMGLGMCLECNEEWQRIYNPDC